MKDFTVPKSPCPHCHIENNGALNVMHDEGPTPGDATICLYCGGWSIFDDDLLMRLPTEDELAEIKAIPQAGMAEAAVLERWKEGDV